MHGDAALAILAVACAACFRSAVCRTGIFSGRSGTEPRYYRFFFYSGAVSVAIRSHSGGIRSDSRTADAPKELCDMSSYQPVSIESSRRSSPDPPHQPIGRRKRAGTSGNSYAAGGQIKVMAERLGDRGRPMSASHFLGGIGMFSHGRLDSVI